ncbi:Dynamin family protein [Lachnospiraceae bacterium XPB1003]|nr:Dynamin family protein [Lachnospiraceae bacterium XPB1003]
MKELMIMYHPVKKEIRFFGRFKGDFVEIPYEDCPHLVKYSPGSGEFLLQNQGSNFFDDIWEQFSRENVNLTFKGTKIDYEDFRKKVADYNEEKEKEIFKIADYIELPNVSEIYEAISDFCGEALESFDSQLKNQETKQMFRLRKKLFDERKAVLDQDEVNLCLVGTYSAGKSTFINAIIGKRILPESINSETAKMYKIRNEYNPRVSFVLNTTREEKPDNIQIIWNAAINQFEVTKSQNYVEDGVRKSLEAETATVAELGLKQHEQLCRILKKLNDIPNKEQKDGSGYINGVIEVGYPIPLCRDINFTFFDTPGTDSNSSEHLLILKEALQHQTNSILIVMYEPTKMEGTGNSVLYKLINGFRDSKKNEQGVSIDLDRSFHVINQADTKTSKDLKLLRNKKVVVSLKEEDKICDEEDMELDLSEARLFFVSSKAAYISKAIQGGIDLDDERSWLANHKNEINNEPAVDPFTENPANIKADSGLFYRYDKLANADFETKQLIADSEKAAKECGGTLDGVIRRIYINSGMYAIEQEIIKYAQKYALAVKAKGLYDSIENLINFVRVDYEAIENQARLSKEHIEKNIEIMKTSMVKDIENAHDEFVARITDDSLETQVAEIKELVHEIEKRQEAASRQADKMQWIALKPEIFEKKNEIIISELNRYLQEIDDVYKRIRGNILAAQVQELKIIIIKKIKEYKGIDEGLIRRIANISETEIPPSELTALKMNDYINEQKAILIFNTMDKKAYKRDLERAFNAQTVEQFVAYKDEVIRVARQRTAEMVDEFKNNIDTISGSLELLVKDENRAIEEQKKAKAVLDMIGAKDAELNRKIWGEKA